MRGQTSIKTEGFKDLPSRQELICSRRRLTPQKDSSSTDTYMPNDSKQRLLRPTPDSREYRDIAITLRDRRPRQIAGHIAREPEIFGDGPSKGNDFQRCNRITIH